MLAARVAERVADRRSRAQHRLHLRRLGRDVVERAQRVAACLLAGRLVELARVLGEPGDELLLQVPGPAARVADRVQLEPVLGDSEPPEERVVEVDHLGVDGRIVRADRLQVELPVLAEAPLLRPSVAVDGLVRVQLHGLRLAVHAVLEVRTDDRRRRLGPERQRAVATVGERVHLLRDDVRPVARGADEELGVLEDRCIDRPIAVERAQLFEARDDERPERLLGREDVVRPPRTPRTS